MTKNIGQTKILCIDYLLNYGHTKDFKYSRPFHNDITDVNNGRKRIIATIEQRMCILS